MAKERFLRTAAAAALAAVMLGAPVRVSAQEVVESVHYQQQAIPKYREGWPEGQPGGMFVTY